jgi:hypothetical protein
VSLLSKLFVALGAFLLGAGVVYGVLARDYEGLTLSLTAAGGALLFGGYGVSALRRARTTLNSATELAAPPATDATAPPATDPTAPPATDPTAPATTDPAAPPAKDSAMPSAPELAADAEPHVGPTIWPLVFAVSAIGLVLGAVAVRWALVPGAILFVLASVGWVLDVHRQWHHHAAGLSGHGSGVLESVSDIHAEPGLEPGPPMGPSTDASTEPGEADARNPVRDMPTGGQPAAAEDGRRR